MKEDAKEEVKKVDKEELMFQEMKAWFEEHEDPVVDYNTMLEAPDRSFF